MVEAVTVECSHIVAPLSPLFHGFWYLTLLGSGFCGEFPANPMIPVDPGGEGDIESGAKCSRQESTLQSSAANLFCREMHNGQSAYFETANALSIPGLASAAGGGPRSTHESGYPLVSSAFPQWYRRRLFTSLARNASLLNRIGTYFHGVISGVDKKF